MNDLEKTIEKLRKRIDEALDKGDGIPQNINEIATAVNCFVSLNDVLRLNSTIVTNTGDSGA